MSPEFGGRTALVTGAAGGIGRVIVRQLLAEGAYVVAFDRDGGALSDAQASWNAGDALACVQGDAADATDMRAAFSAIEQRNLQLAALVTCAGVMGEAPAEAMSDDEWRRVVRVNLRGTFLPCQSAARLMVRQGFGAIVTFASALAFRGGVGVAHYSASKAAVAAFTKSLALEVAPRGVRANVIAPGAIDTPMPRSRPGRTPEDVERVLHDNPSGGVGTPQDVAEAVLFLLSDRSRHITGQVVHINGGTLRP